MDILKPMHQPRGLVDYLDFKGGTPTGKSMTLEEYEAREVLRKKEWHDKCLTDLKSSGDLNALRDFLVQVEQEDFDLAYFLRTGRKSTWFRDQGERRPE